MKSSKEELETLMNKLNIPDFIMAEMIYEISLLLEKAFIKSNKWNGIDNSKNIKG